MTTSFDAVVREKDCRSYLTAGLRPLIRTGFYGGSGADRWSEFLSLNAVGGCF